MTTGNAYQKPGEPLPIYWGEAIERFARSEFAAHYPRREIRAACSTAVKRAEMQEFSSHITPLEIERYLGPL